MQPTAKQVRRVGLVVIILLLFGAVSFALSDHVSFGEGFYRATYVVLAHHDNFQSTNGVAKTTVLILIISSLLLIAYLLKWLAEYMIGLGDGLKRRQMKAKVAHMKHHYIICGLGRVGSQVARELHAEGVEFVGLDSDEERVKEAIAHGYTALVGDSTKEEVLQAVGIGQAKGLVASLGDDSSNLFVTLAARQLNPHLFIVARANRDENKQRLLRAGADRVAMPYQIGGYHMATMMIRPNVVDFLEVLSSTSKEELQIAELVVPEGSPLAGEQLDWLRHNNVSATVLALNNLDGTSRVNPSGRETIYAGDKLIIMGTPAQLQEVNSKI